MHKPVGEHVGARSADLGLLILLCSLNALNFVDRNLLSSFANFLKPELGLTDAQYGLLTGLVFLAFYAVAGLFMGVLADRTNRPRLIAAATVVWSLLTAASGAARGFLSLAAPRALIGVGESALSPAALSLLADRISPNRLGLAAALYYLGVPIGAGASLLIAGYLGPTVGWRGCFYALGALGLLMAGSMLFVREPRHRRAEGAAPQPTFGAQFKRLLAVLRQSPALIAIIVGGVFLHIAIGAAQFDQLWFTAERGFERAQVARLTGFITVGVGIAGNLFGGFAGDWWRRRMRSERPMLLFALMLLTFPLIVAYRLAPAGSPIFFIGVGAVVFQLSAFYGPTFATIQQLTPPDARATVTAFYILCLNVVGLGIGITGTGWAVDALRAADVAQPYTVAILAFTGLSVFAIPAFFLAGVWSREPAAEECAA